MSKRNQRLPLLGDDDATAERNYIREFVLTRGRDVGAKYGLAYAEAFHYIGPGAGRRRIDEYIRQHAVPK